jgi:hypothetical protein
MRERIDETIQVPSFSESLVNTNDAVADRVKAEHEKHQRATEYANKRHAELLASYDATFRYRVGLILSDPEVQLPPLPQWDREVAG